MDWTLKGQTALITGASRGIGRVIAITLARAGADVALAARSEKNLHAVASEIEALGRRVVVIPTDMSSREAVTTCGRGAIEALGHLDILVNNAATFGGGAVADLDPDVFERQLRTNLMGVMQLSQAVVPHMAERGAGTIVMMSSTSGLRADPGGAAYAASKHGLQALGESLLREVRGQGVRVVMVCPSTVDTRTVEDPDSLPRSGKGIHLRAEDVADAVLFACALPGRALVRQIELWGTNP
jgi:3-oxoacyl-[acyl-carrier protein] reductase